MSLPITINRSVLHASCKLVDQKSVLTERYHQTPLKITKTFREPESDALMLYMMDVSPGLMEGDQYELRIKQEEQTHLVLTNQSFTKIHPALMNGASVNAKFELGKGARLEYMPEPTIPYKDSIFQGRNQFYLSEDASLIFVEITTPGRTHRDEKFQFTKCATTTEIYMEGQLVACDSFCLIPQRHPHALIGVLEHYTHQAMMWIFSPQAKDELLQIIRLELEACDQTKLLAAASLASRGGIVVRMLGSTVWELQQLTQRLWNLSRSRLWQLSPCNLRK
ncbi:urease accessory protein UreD [Paenibacillus montaniterrae]|uniref:Urease accessory protein UreD n=1 Tax=Paenibacillus montaniterrae TaxID=429341 RepID=A0A920CTI5_9BACL|nr:urease accessory protein UreD [Paenibacillus montaniterrae]GIP15937.1 urease accessory protein UreD [Paenibacillus montaniterrae]